MKLSRIYSNRPDLFRTIDFNDGVNVIYAKVTKPKDSNKDSHNLGKTLLIHLIDFLLLKDVGEGHFLYDHRQRFAGVEFFLELRTNAGRLVTIRRGVDRPTKISLKTHTEQRQDYRELPQDQWDAWEQPIGRSQTQLNTLLDLDAIAPWDYRKGVTYFLRTQADYLDVFQIGKFALGKHGYWKPYMAKVLGFSSEQVQTKYKLDDQIDDKQNFRKEAEKQFRTDPGNFDKVKGTIEIKRAEAEGIRERVNRFNFFEQEVQASSQLVEQIESQVATLNDRLYTSTYEIEKIKQSLSEGVSFDLAKVRQVFEEAKLYFPDALTKSYEQLLDFNRRLSDERNRRLGDRLSELERERDEAEQSLRTMNERREAALRFLQDKDTFAKFKTLQAELVRREAEIARLESELENLGHVTAINRQVLDLTKQRNELVVEIAESVNQGNPLYSDIRTRFNKIIRQVLDLPALLSISINKEGNLDFGASILHDESTLQASSEGQGTSYRKLLCAAFDMAVLEAYSNVSFYRFVYHDGVLEGLDNRKKQKYLGVVEDFCRSYGLQYILTVIDADLPRDQEDRKIMFPPEVVIRELHEDGDSGRLFNMPKF